MKTYVALLRGINVSGQKPIRMTDLQRSRERLGSGSSVVSDTYGANVSLLAFVRAGQAARLTLSTHVSGDVLFSQGSISGYLINAPQYVSVYCVR
jgi:hypothetical protein